MIVTKKFEQYSDSEVIEKVLANETALYEIIIRRYNPFLYKTGRAYGYNHQDTEDLMQETYVAVYCNLSNFEHRASFKTWITRIMLNNCYQKKQKFSFRNEIVIENSLDEKDLPLFSNHMDPTKTILNKELSHVLENALEQLPVDYRMVFSLRELNGLNVKETAQAMDISENNVKVRLNRAKMMLRSEVEKNYSPSDIFEFNLIYCDRMVERVMKEIENRV